MLPLGRAVLLIPALVLTCQSESHDLAKHAAHREANGNTRKTLAVSRSELAVGGKDAEGCQQAFVWPRT